MALGFTGFGLTALPVLGLVLVVDAWRGPAPQRWHAPALVTACLLTPAAFLVDYRFMVSAEGFQVFRPNPLDCLQFMAAMLSHFVLTVQRMSWRFLYPVGAVFLAAIPAVFGSGLKHLAVRSTEADTLASHRFSQECVMLVGCSLVFALPYRIWAGAAGCAGGRRLALHGADVPAVMAIWLVLFRYRQLTAPVLLALLVLFLLRSRPETRLAYQQGRYHAAVTLCWLEPYRATGGSVAQSVERLLQLDECRGYQAGWMGQQAQWDFMERPRLGPLARSAGPAPLLSSYSEPCGLLQAP